jgi:hypothetical protein
MPRTKHGESARGGSGKTTTPEYRTWVLIRARCYCKTHHKFPDYGAKGIRVCSRWMNSYKNFLADMGRKPSAQHTLDRKDGTKGYTPGNCRWATRKQQNRNKRTNRILTVDGESLCVVEWAERYGVDPNTIHMRLKCGWNPREAVTRPIQKKGGAGGKGKAKSA